MERDNVLRALRDPRLAFLWAHWNLHRRILGENGIQVMDEDWDNLLILDACRYDLFEKRSTLSGNLRPVTSAGSHTIEFLHSNFDGLEFPDTVYVTATPQFRHEGMENRFHDVYHLWRDEWNEDYRTVLPETVANAARQAEAEHPDKRLIAHFVQPHYPFIGEHGRKLDELVEAKSGLEGEQRNGRSIWDNLEQDIVPESLVRRAYAENLDLVLPVVESLLSDLIGKSVVTSDHGNAFGKWGIYGHPPKKFLSELVTVPWLVLKADTRKEIVAGDTLTDKAHHAEGELEERLTSLGYLE